MQKQPQPGWYPDPEQPGRERWWSGERWRDQWRSAQTPTPLPEGLPADQQPLIDQQQPTRRGVGCLFAILGAVIAAIVIIMVVVAVGSSSKHLGRGTGSHPAAADISVTACTVDPALKIPSASGTIVNHSSDTSDYTFTISFINSVGTVVAQGGGIDNDIAPHQSAQWSTNADIQVAGSVACKVANITRFASHQ